MFAGIVGLAILGSSSASTTDTVIKAESRMVLVPVTVTDHYGKPLLDLQAENFRVFEDAQPRPIHSLWREEAPASVAIVLDLSGSMRNKLPEALAAVVQVTRALDPEDAAAMITFSDRPRVVSDFALDPDVLPGRLTDVQTEGGTALIDAIYLAIHQVREIDRPRKALVVISDGADNSSRYNEKELALLVVESDVQIYTIGIAESVVDRDTMRGLYLLEALSKMSGGLHFTVRDRSILPEAAARLAYALKNLYVIAYQPPPGSTSGKWRKVRVSLTPPAGRSARINAKSGYFEP